MPDEIFDCLGNALMRGIIEKAQAANFLLCLALARPHRYSLRHAHHME
jgi:hypothetical protein